MQAITTKVIPATSYHPTRIKAACERGSITTTYPDGAGEQAHRKAARMLCEQFANEDLAQRGEPLSKNPWLRPFVTGHSYDGNYQHVFTA